MLVALSRLATVAALAVGLVAAPTAGAPPAGAVEQVAAPTVSGLRTNALTDPLGIGGDAPLLGWRMDAPHRAVTQTAYDIRVATSKDGLANPDVWDSGKVASDRSVEVRYGGPALASHTQYLWSVRVWDDRGAASAWSAPATFETGLTAPGDWTADWVTANDGSAVGPEWKDYRIEFTASHITGALGVYFRGRDTEHAYMWQLSEAENSLRPHVKNGGYSVLPATKLPAGFDWSAAHRYAIDVSGTTISTSVDGTLLDRRTDSTFTTPGIMGFRTSGSEGGTVRDLTVTSANGQVLVDSDFRANDRTFTAGSVTADGLRVAGNSEAWLATGQDVPLLRKEFTLEDKPVASARVYATAQGLYELDLNGAKVGDEELAPGVTDYHKRIDYQTYDVTRQLHGGVNAIGAELANGWYAGRVAMFGDKVWGDHTALIAQLRVTYADGTTQTIGTDDTWRTTAGPITSADLLDGESVDGRRAAALAGWSKPGFDASSWKAVSVSPSATSLLEPQSDQPVRVTQELAAHRIASPTAGTYIYDLGQNMVGKSRITLTGKPGETVRIRYAEVLNKDGSVYTDNLRSAKATDYYTFATDGPETFEPTFTFHGFRYIEITGVDQAPADSDVTGVVMGTDGDLTNRFQTSSALVNQLNSNITWGQRGNFLSIPTDTPARDERMGWTGDIDVFSRTAVYNMDSQAFLGKWLQDLRDTQNADGAFPGVAPTIPNRFDGGYGSAGWADAGVHVPWAVWQAYGDTQVIRDNYDAMKRYVDYLDRDSTNHIRSAGGYLDWLNLDDNTSADVLDTAFVARSTRELAEMAAAIGRDADAAAYRNRFEAIRKAYQDAFIAPDGTVKSDSQTAYILTINDGLVPADREQQLADKFVKTIQRRDWHLSTGFLGVDGLLPALTAIGRTDVAYRLLQNTDYPSWGYEIANGATTVWERWNSIMPDGSFGDVGMNSFNHYAYGAVGEWMYRTLAGVSALEPGYRRILVAPQPGAGIDWASMKHETPYGTVASAWKRTDDGISLDVTVPGNTTAEVHVPASSRWAVTEGGRPAEDATGVKYLRMEDGAAVFAVGSGDYEFGIDTVLGDIGTASDSVAALRSAVDDLGSASAPVRSHLDVQLAKLADEMTTAWDARVSGDDTAAASDVHRAISTSADLRRWVTTQQGVDRVSAADADTVRAGLAGVEKLLSSASGTLVGAVVRLLPPTGDVMPGDTTTVSVSVENRGTRSISGLTSSLVVPDGWTATPVGAPATSVAAGATVRHDYRVTVPATAAPRSWELQGSVSYQYQSSSATLPVSAALALTPAVVVDSVTVTPASARPGDRATVEAVVRNRASTPRDGSLALRLPDGWAAVPAQAFTVVGSGTTTLRSEVTVPLGVTEGSVPVVAAVGATDLEQRTAPLRIDITNPPASYVDHADLGDAADERAHNLTASPASGTNVEAGLTRRYTNSAQPGGWFELDLKVPTDRPAVIRMVETYDSPQLKTYDVLADGVVVQQRRYKRNDGGQGALTWQFVLDRPDLTKDGVVRLRFQDVDADYDPSIADVWSIAD
jgi:hypothetical protein